MKNIDIMTGSDIRHYLKQMWKHDKKIYNELIDYLARYDKKDVRNKLIKHCNQQKYTFSEETLKVLLKVFTRFQEEAIQESMSFLDFIMKNLESGKGSNKNFLKKSLIKKNTFRKSVSQKKKNTIRKNTFRKSVSQKKKNTIRKNTFRKSVSQKKKNTFRKSVSQKNTFRKSVSQKKKIKKKKKKKKIK